MNAYQYFVVVGKIWQDFNDGKIEAGERDKRLRPWRAIVKDLPLSHE